MKKILITGGSGFIGSNLVNLLLKRNIQLSILINLHILQILIMLKNLEITKLPFFKLDINQRTKIIKIIKNINLRYN